MKVYKNCSKVEELDIFLKDFNFERVLTSWGGNTWGLSNLITWCLSIKK